MFCEIMGKSEEVTLFSKIYKANKANNIDVNKLIRVFCLLLKFTIIDF